MRDRPGEPYRQFSILVKIAQTIAFPAGILRGTHGFGARKPSRAIEQPWLELGSMDPDQSHACQSRLFLRAITSEQDPAQAILWMDANFVIRGWNRSSLPCAALAVRCTGRSVILRAHGAAPNPLDGGAPPADLRPPGAGHPVGISAGVASRHKPVME